MGIYTVRLNNVTGQDVISLSDGSTYAALEAVSYTHLTLPTKA